MLYKVGKSSAGVYSLYKSMVSQNRRFASVPDWVRADLKWWLNLSVLFNGISKMVRSCYHHAMVSDSSLKGFGVYLGSDWCAGTWHIQDVVNLVTDCNYVGSKPLVDKFDDKNINVLELWPILVGIKCWAPMLQNLSLIVFTDNTQVLFMLLNGKSSNVTCMHWIRELFWTCAFYNIEIIPKYKILPSLLERSFHDDSRNRLIKKNELTRCPRGMRGKRPNHEIDRYVYPP